MYGGLIPVVILALIVLSPIIWFVWWTLADLSEGGHHRPHAV